MKKIIGKICLISFFITFSTTNCTFLTSCNKASDDFTKKLTVKFEENSNEGTNFTLNASGSETYTTLGHFVITYGDEQIVHSDDLTFEFVCDSKDFDSNIYDIKNSVSVNYAQNIVFQNNATECFSNVKFSVNIWYHLHSDDVQYVHYCDKNFTISSENFSIVWENSNLEDLNFSLDDTTKPYISDGYFIPYFNGQVVDPNNVEFHVVYDEEDLKFYHLDEIKVIALENNECHIELPAPYIQMEHSFKLNFAIHAKYTSDQHEYTSDYEGFQVTKKLALPINAFKIEINQSNKKILQGMSDDYIKNQDKYAQYDSIVIPNDIDEIEFGAFAESSLDSNIKYISFQKDSKISVIPYNFIHGNDSITDIDFKNVTELKSIQDNAFNNASALKNVDFSNCKNLIEIHDNAFAHSSIESIDLSNCSQIQKFYSFAFYQCLNLVELVLPSQVTEIDTYAFSDCIGLRLIIWNQNGDITYKNTTIRSNAFLNIYSDPNECGVLKSSNLTISSNILSWLQGKDGTGVKGNFPINNWESSN